MPQIRTTDVPFEWRRFRLPQPNVRRPLSLALENSFEFFFIDAGRTRVDLGIPTIDRPLSTIRSMTIRAVGSGTTSNPATVRLR